MSWVLKILALSFTSLPDELLLSNFKFIYFSTAWWQMLGFDSALFILFSSFGRDKPALDVSFVTWILLPLRMLPSGGLRSFIDSATLSSSFNCPDSLNDNEKTYYLTHTAYYKWTRCLSQWIVHSRTESGPFISKKKLLRCWLVKENTIFLIISFNLYRSIEGILLLLFGRF
jgi:hypothetical protein